MNRDELMTAVKELASDVEGRKALRAFVIEMDKRLVKADRIKPRPARNPAPAKTEPISKRLSAHLAARRRDVLGIGQEELAERLGVCHMTVARWEVGKIQPSLNTFAHWAEEVGTTLRSALGEINR